MTMDREKQHEDQQQTPAVQQGEKPQHSSAFNESSPDEQKSNSNTEEADMEQARKEAMTERD